MTLLPKNVYPETSVSVQRVTAVTRSARQKIVNQAAIPLHQRKRDLFGLKWRQLLDRWINQDRLEHAKSFHLERVADGEIQIRNAVVSLEHCGQNLVQVWCS